MDFKNNKKQILESSDLSRKGSVDDLIVDLVNFINGLDDFVTTSSCSGRILLYSKETADGCKNVKKGCKWLLTSHCLIDGRDLISKADASEGDLCFKFEPFILHVQCANIESAKKLHTIALGCGFRESGITIGKFGKLTLAIRSNAHMEVPLSQDNIMLVSDVYLKFLAGVANEKMQRNEMKIKHFMVILKEMFGGNPETT